MKKLFCLLLVLMMVVLAVISCDTNDNVQIDDIPDIVTTEEVTTEEATTEEVTEADTGYKVKVVDAEGNAIEGVWIMICKGDTCSMPVATGADGYAKFPTITDEGRQAKVAYEVEGYVVDTTKYIDFEAGSFEMTIVLEKA